MASSSLIHHHTTLTFSGGVCEVGEGEHEEGVGATAKWVRHRGQECHTQPPRRRKGIDKEYGWLSKKAEERDDERDLPTPPVTPRAKIQHEYHLVGEGERRNTDCEVYSVRKMEYGGLDEWLV